MAPRGKSSPTLLGRWFEGQWKPFALKCWCWTVLIVAFAIPLAVVIKATQMLPPSLEDIFGPFGDPPRPGQAPGDLTIWSIAVVGAWLWWAQQWMTGQMFRTLMVESYAPIARHFAMKEMGKGGSAHFAGLLDEWAHPYTPGTVRLGRSLYDNSVIGYDDDRGLLTIASNRSGKGRALIIPNLITWPGSVVVIDPKGTNAAVTAARRGQGGGRVTESLGQPVHVLDPFGIVEGVKSARFNPLSGIDLNGNRAREDVGLIADALVVSTNARDSHWDEGGRTILTGLIAHILSQNPAASLVDVREALKQDADGLDELFGAMMSNDVAGGVAQGAASFIASSSPNARGDLLATVQRNTAWLDSAGMRQILTHSDFSMATLKTQASSVYVVLPPDLLDEHARFMRLFVNLAVRAASQGGKAKVPILLIMDEFYALGTLGSLAKASGALAGYGLKLWPILQNLSQLSELYPKNWQTFFANAGAVQIFGVNDRGTAEEIVAGLGRSVWLEKIDDRSARNVTNLLEAQELEQLTERSQELQLVLRSGKAPMLLKKSNYDQDPDFSKAMYEADPDHPGS